MPNQLFRAPFRSMWKLSLSLSHAHARTISLSLSHTHTHFLSLWIMCAKPSSSTYAPFLSLHGRFVTSHQAQARCAGNVRVVHGEGGYAGSVRVVCRKGECAGSVRVYIRCLHLSRPTGPGYVWCIRLQFELLENPFSTGIALDMISMIRGWKPKISALINVRIQAVRSKFENENWPITLPILWRNRNGNLDCPSGNRALIYLSKCPIFPLLVNSGWCKFREDKHMRWHLKSLGSNRTFWRCVASFQ